MAVLLHNLDCFSPPEKIQALIDELKAKDNPVYDDDIAFLEEELAFAKEMLDVHHTS